MRIHLGPTACAYAKLNEYFGKLQSSKIESAQSQGDFGGDLSVREGLQAKKQRPQSKMGSVGAAISGMEDMIQNTLLRAAIQFPDVLGGGNDLWNLRDIGKLYNLEIRLEDSRGEKKTWNAGKCS